MSNVIRTLGFVVAVIALAGAARAEGCTALEDDLVGFLAGSYALIGRMPSGESTYAATVALTPDGCGLRIARCEASGTLVGEAEIGYATADRVPVLDFVYRRGGETVRGRYLIDGDLDNYPVLTGTYVVGDDTESVGREYLFVERGGKACG